MLKKEGENVVKSEIQVTQRKIKIKKITEVIGFFSANIGLLSIISSVVSKYISIGRCWYFDFDLDYYDFSLSNTSKLIFYISVVAGIISGFVSMLIYTVWKRITPYFEKKIGYKKCINIIIALIILFISFIIIIAIILFLFIPVFEMIKLICLLVFVFSIITFFIIYLNDPIDEKKKIALPLSAIAFIILFVIALSMRAEYDNAKNQRIFPIIVESADENLEYYVVISTGKEKYSAYLCEIREEKGKNVLHIITDKHKYFNINDTDTVRMQFQEIKRKESSLLTVNEILNNSQSLVN